ncbi:U3 small nucleolar ribonucleoprotein protein IMP4-like [Leucoraja erinacea]|uniref:U3 small nucleolar ribonucleoprotein protein IMP4-like n=1 Tax=Leucoraja erinaceus TaxID=7782 RepID=UPI00245694ED|nr:U3 small nucleolar ribonucleoprotein protein IMP4-like [Leucoraja erinacea]
MMDVRGNQSTSPPRQLGARWQPLREGGLGLRSAVCGHRETGMLRRQARLRREYLYRKAQEDKLRSIEDKKLKLRSALDDNKLIPTELRREALELQKAIEYDDQGGEGVLSQMDDEYKWAGVEDPKIMITSSRDPSSKLKQFVKEVKLIFPNSQRMNRGKHDIEALVMACKANGVTDLLIVHEHRGVPGQAALPASTPSPRVETGPHQPTCPSYTSPTCPHSVHIPPNQFYPLACLTVS